MGSFAHTMQFLAAISSSRSDDVTNQLVFLYVFLYVSAFCWGNGTRTLWTLWTNWTLWTLWSDDVTDPFIRLFVRPLNTLNTLNMSLIRSSVCLFLPFFLFWSIVPLFVHLLSLLNLKLHISFMSTLQGRNVFGWKPFSSKKQKQTLMFQCF